MTTSSLPVLESSRPPPPTKVELRMRPIFVTQSEDSRHKQRENLPYSPAETLSRVLEGGVTSLQKTLVLNKQADLKEVTQQLVLKRQEFKSYVEVLAQRRSELEVKLQQTKDSVMKFEKFVAENETKRRRAQKRCETTREHNTLKQGEIEALTQRLRQLGARKQLLKQRMEKYKIYEDYLMKTLEFLPGDHVDNGTDSLVMPIIRRHETLSITYQGLLQRLGHMEEEVKQGQRRLQSMKQEHGVKKLMASKELSDLQGELETLRKKNKRVEVNLQTERGLSREKVGRLFMAVNNLAEQCYLPAFGPLETMSILTMMDMVKEYILDKADTETRTRRLLEAGSMRTSTTAVAGKTEKATRKESMRTMGSKTQIKSPSKVSKKRCHVPA